MDDKMQETTENRHFKRGRWYRVGDFELCITETTIRGFRVLQRPLVDKLAPADVESPADAQSSTVAAD